MTDDRDPRVQRRLGALRTRLDAWGATQFTETEGTKPWRDPYVRLEYHTPMPGDQPIRSHAEVAARGVVRGVTRFGVLEESASSMHRGQMPDEVERLKAVVGAVEPPSEASIIVNFGDQHWPPRPHVIYGWKPGRDFRTGVVQHGPETHPAPVAAYVDYLEQVGRRLREEYDGEWAGGGA